MFVTFSYGFVVWYKAHCYLMGKDPAMKRDIRKLKHTGIQLGMFWVFRFILLGNFVPKYIKALQSLVGEYTLTDVYLSVNGFIINPFNWYKIGLGFSTFLHLIAILRIQLYMVTFLISIFSKLDTSGFAVCTEGFWQHHYNVGRSSCISHQFS